MDYTQKEVKRVYLDNNILVNIEDEIYQIEDFLKLSNAAYYYSDAHISELLNGIDKSLSGLKDKRLKTINALCGCNYLFQDTPSRIRLALCKPDQAYENVSNNGSRKYLNLTVNTFSPNRAGIIKELAWNAKEVGNCAPNEIFEAIDKKCRESKYHFGIREFLLFSGAYTLSNVFATLFNLLDMVSYRKDKNSVARFYDSRHTYYAQECAIFVSDDAKLRAKAEAVYHYLDINTKVMDGPSYLSNKVL